MKEVNEDSGYFEYALIIDVMTKGGGASHLTNGPWVVRGNIHTTMRLIGNDRMNAS